MNTIERMFKFPIRIYDSMQDEEDEKFGSMPNQSPVKWVRGWKRIWWEDIIDIGDTYHYQSDIDNIINNGFDASTITTTEKSYICDWTLLILEKKLNSHIENVEESFSHDNKKSSSPPSTNTVYLFKNEFSG